MDHNDPSETDNRRRYTRVDYDADVSICHAGTLYTAKLIDISLKGMLVRLPDSDIMPNQIVDIALPLSDDVIIRCAARWAHKKGDVAGLQITRLDADSMQHLCRLIQYNSDDRFMLERDLHQLASE